MTPFLEVLFELSHITGLKLYPDKHEACKLAVTDHLSIQLEMSPEQDSVLIACMIIEILPGKFQEEVLKHALASNAEVPLEYGILSYVPKKSSLALTDKLPIRLFKGNFLIDYLKHFIDKAEKWRLAIHQGSPGPNKLPSPGHKKPNPFGLTR